MRKQHSLVEENGKKRDGVLTATEWLSTGKVARALEVSQQTAIRLVDSGKIKGERMPGSRFRRVRGADLMHYMREHGYPPPKHEPLPKLVVVAYANNEPDSAFTDLLERLKVKDRVSLYVETDFDAALRCVMVQIPDVVLVSPSIRGEHLMSINRCIVTRSELMRRTRVAMYPCFAVVKHEDLVTTELSVNKQQPNQGVSLTEEELLILLG